MDEGTPVWFRLTIDLATEPRRRRADDRPRPLPRHPLRGLRQALRDRGARMTRSPARRALRIAGVLAAVAFVALLVYGLTTKADELDDRRRALARRGRRRARASRSAKLADGRDAGAAWSKAAADGDVALVGAARHAARAQLLGLLVRPVPRRGEGAREGLEGSSRACCSSASTPRTPARTRATSSPSSGSRSRTCATRATRRSATGASPGCRRPTSSPPTASVVGHVIGTVDEPQLRDGIAAARSGRPAGSDQGGEQRPVR